MGINIMEYYFSKEKKAFYLSSFIEIYKEACSWPEDAVKISEGQYKKFLGNPPDGKILSGDSEGKPIWVEKPPKTDLELNQIIEKLKKEKISQALLEIKPLEIIEEIDEISEEEKEKLLRLKQYIIKIARVNFQEGYPNNIVWPTLTQT